MSRIFPSWFTLWQPLFVICLGYELVCYWNGRRGDTLSERVAHWQNIVPPLRYVVCATMLWMTYHFATATVDAAGVVHFRWSGRELLQVWIIALFGWAVVALWPRAA